MAARPSGQQGEQGEEPGTERGGPVPPSEPTTTTNQDEAMREKDGALGVSGGQPDVSPSGPNNNSSSPEPKVKNIV